MPDRGERRERAGVLHPALAARRIEVGRAEPPDALASHVDYLWWVTWRSPEPYVQEVIPRPVLHLYAEARDAVPRLLVTGVMSSRFERVLAGTGRTVAAAFRPGGFRPFLGSSVGALRDREVPVADLLGVDDRPLAAELLDPALPVEEAADRLAAWLATFAPEPDPEAERLAALVEQAESEIDLVRAEQLAERAGVSLRTLQRRFDEYVGIGPKWVVQRFRLLDVAEAAHTDDDVDWAALAVRLGYADQSHLIRAFTALVGRPPAAYARGDGVS